ncbi:MAG TPA: exonuclease domain-containing protein, partial [Dehalococcoidia bacterium]|nr:exonuclease domain-containing protein [Dehalococcoidia bacterium]
MPKTCVALDLETTGLDPRQDEIIEVGVTKFCGDEVIATFQRFVKPRRLVPYSVQLLTGITNQDLQDAPPFAVIAADLLLFLDDHPLVGQNAPFDLKFLAEQGIQLQNPVYDTLDLAKILVPTLSERNLTALASYFGIPYPVKHRALPDAQATKDVFLGLLARAHALDPRVLSPLCNLGAEAGWALAGFFQDVLLEKLTSAPSSPLPSDFPVSQLRIVPPIPGEDAPQEEEHPHPAADVETGGGALDVDRLTWFLGPDGPLAKALPSFEHRPEQIAMTQTVAEALNDQTHLIAEAGTGTGKSLAYLLPALCYAILNDTKVVISTNTINLQEQIVSKDIPLLLQALERVSQENPPASLPRPAQVRVAQLKGRGNYLCPRRWSTVVSGASAEMEPGLLARIAV